MFLTEEDTEMGRKRHALSATANAPITVTIPNANKPTFATIFSICAVVMLICPL